MRRVMILGGRAPVALDHARRFAHQGWQVHVADSVSFELTRSSRSVSGSMRLPSPRHCGAAFARALSRYVHDHGVELLIPTCEEVFFVARYRDQLPRELRVVADDFETLRRLHSKLSFVHIARECDVDVPQSTAVHRLDEAREWAQGRPCVLKPEFSRFGVFVRLYPQGIPDDAAELAAQGTWVAQSFCEGMELCSYSIAHAGRLLAHQTYRPKYRLGRSSSYYFEPVDEPRIGSAVERFVAHTRFTGQISFDWVRGSDGRCTALECNPRATSGLHLFNLNDGLPAAFANSHVVRTDAAKQTPRMLAAIMASAGFVQALRDRRVKEWQRDFAHASDVLAVAGDRKPTFGAIADLASYMRLALRDRCSLREAATQDIEWDGQAI